MASEPVTSSVVLPPWKCPECGVTNTHTTARCMNRRYDPDSPRFEAVPPVPPEYDLQSLGEYLEKLGVRGVRPPAEIWRCPYVRPCDLCDRPGHPHSGGELRCDEHPLQEANRVR